MNIKNLLLQGISIGSVAVCFFGLTSCRTSDTENSNNLTEGTKAQVNINFMGTAFKDGGLDPQASLKSAGISGNAGKEQSKSVMITPSTVMVTTLSPVKSNSSAQAGLKNTLAAVAGNPLGNGIKFRVIAYKSSGGAYQTYQDYTIGQAAPPMTLDTGVTYNIVAYSYGTTSLPTITPEETSNISNAQIAYDNNNRDLMYVKQSYTPSSTNTNLPITLMHQLMQITTSVTTNIGDINSIANAALTPNFSNGVFSLNTGVMSGRTTQANQNIDFSGNTFPVMANTPVNATPVLINANTTGNGASFSASLNIGGTNKLVNLTSGFDITPGTQNNLNVGIVKCGAWMDAAHTQWKEFMCQNLGATSGINPFIPIAGNHGAKYQWGAQTGEIGRYVDQTTDQSNSGALLPWISYATSVKPNGSWTGTPGGGTSNPCGNGYRVPTKVEWENVLISNTLERTGTWANNITNYATALYIKDPISNTRTLMLPAGGYRYGTDGSLNSHGSNGFYWSSTESTGAFAYGFGFTSSTALVADSGYRTSGLPIRCIAE
ncbi:hypothetical protein CMT37_05130 [Elizabethkingia anophelis]|nr:hypothetical protein [Elizabethkingia anophelis]